MSAVVHAELQQPSTGSVRSVENSVVSRLRSLCIQNDGPEEERREEILNRVKSLLDELNSSLADLNVGYSEFALVKGNSILCFFICSSEKQLQQLWSHYASGLMKHVLENVFSLLVNNDERVVIRELQWELEEYRWSVQRVKLLNAFG